MREKFIFRGQWGPLFRETPLQNVLRKTHTKFEGPRVTGSSLKSIPKIRGERVKRGENSYFEGSGVQFSGKHPCRTFYRRVIRSLKVLRRLEVGQSHDQRKGGKMRVKCKKKLVVGGEGQIFRKTPLGNVSQKLHTKFEGPTMIGSQSKARPTEALETRRRRWRI